MPKANYATVIALLCLALTVVIGWQCAKQLDNPTAPTSIEPEHQISRSSQSFNLSPEVAGVEITAGYPDLTVDSARLANSIDIVTRTIQSKDCAIAESCATPGSRRLLRFDVALMNFGTSDLYVGNPRQNPDLFEYSECHKHYHFKNFSEYRLKDGAGVVRAAHKQAFCFIDILQYWAGYKKRYQSCNKQGISVGWADLYDKSLACQWIDITGVSAGNYTIEVEINLSKAFNEGDNIYRNTISVPVTIP